MPLLAYVCALSVLGNGVSARAEGTSAQCGRTPAPPSPKSQTGNTLVCTQGPWSAVKDETDEGQKLVFESEHFAFKSKAADLAIADLKSAAATLEEVWTFFTGDTIGFKPPFCNEGKKSKVNVYVGDGYPFLGGTDSAGLPWIKVPPTALLNHWVLAHEFTHCLQGTASAAGGSRMTTEFITETHANWMAHQLKEYHSSAVNCSEMLPAFSHLYYGNVRTRYCSWHFIEYIKNQYGYKVTAEWWSKRPPYPNPALTVKDPIAALALDMGWSTEGLNDVFGAWAMSNVGWNYINPDGTDQGVLYRKKFGPYQFKISLPDDLTPGVSDSPTRSQTRLSLPAGYQPAPGEVPKAGKVMNITNGTSSSRFTVPPDYGKEPTELQVNPSDLYFKLTSLDAVDAAKRIYAVNEFQAPQRWGYNVVRLIPDAPGGKITVRFRGVLQTVPGRDSFPGRQGDPSVIPAPASGWRWGVVTLDKSGKEALRSPLMAGSSGVLSVTAPTGGYMFLVVAATPQEFHRIEMNQPYYSIYRYPWMVKLEGAYPSGSEPSAPAPVKGARRHPNGNGWVGPSASVEPSVFIGPGAVVAGGTVTGNARIEDHAVVIDGKVTGNAVVGGLTVVTNGMTVKDKAIVKTTFKSPGASVQNLTIGGTAVLYGDVDVRQSVNAVKSGFVTGLVTADTLKESAKGESTLMGGLRNDGGASEITVRPRFDPAMFQ